MSHICVRTHMNNGYVGMQTFKTLLPDHQIINMFVSRQLLCKL